MDTSGCPPGRFSDHMLVYDSPRFNCDNDVATWLGITIFLWVFRLVILVLVWVSWFQQRKVRMGQDSKPNAVATSSGESAPQQRGTTGKSSRHSTRFPLLPFISTLDTFAIGLAILLGSLNITNAINGTMLILLFFWLYIVCIIQFLSLKKMVSLGFRILRFDASAAAITQQNSSVSQLASFDHLLKAFWMTMFALLPITMGFAIAGATDAAEPNHVYGRVAVALFAVEQTIFYLSMIYQYHRCIRCVQSMMGSPAVDGNDGTRKAFAVAIGRMRYQQLVIMLTGIGAVGLLTYFAWTLRLYWWLLVFAFALDCFIYFFMVLSFLRCGSSKRPGSNKSKDAAVINRSSSNEKSAIRTVKTVGSMKRTMAAELTTATTPTTMMLVSVDPNNVDEEDD